MTAKIGFLFGAGAERDFKIRSGVEFATGLLKKDQRVHEEIKEHYDNRRVNHLFFVQGCQLHQG